jgi:hypothetical protein
LDVPVEIDWIIKNRGRTKYRGVMHLVRFSPVDGWKVDSLRFLTENHFPKQKKHLY